MSDGLSKHIGALTLGTDAGEEKPSDGTMDGGNATLEEIPSVEQRAVPDTVVDDQAKQFERTSKTEKKEEPLDYKALYETEQKAAAGRLGDLQRVRSELSQTKDGINDLRKVFLERDQKEAERLADEEKSFELAEERRLYGDEVVDDPGVSYMRDKMVQTQDMLEQQARNQEQFRQNVMQQANQQREAQNQWHQTRNTVMAQEEEFAAKTPDYGDAYMYTRQKQMEMYKNRGYTQEQAEITVDQAEEGIRQEQLSRPGGSVPQAVYEMAKMYGWTPDMAQAKEGEENKEPAKGGISAPNFNKMRQGVGSGGAGRMHGRSGASDGSRALSAEEFFNTVSLSDRLEILSDPDKFEELGRTGQIMMD